MTNSTIAVTPILYKTPLIDPLRDFVPLGMVSGSPFFLVINPKIQAHSVADLIRLAKERPNQISYSTSGVGLTAYMLTQMFIQMAGVELLNVPYKGALLAISDVMAAHVNLQFADPGVGPARL